MKRFYKAAEAVPVESGWQVQLDGRAVKTQRGAVQVVPGRQLAEALAAEWAAQGEEIDPRGFVFRDLTDYAIDMVSAGRIEAVRAILPFAETDTLCYRADPDEPLYRRQLALWEPIVSAAEQRHGIVIERVSGIIHRAQPAASLARLRALLEAMDAYTLAATHTLASLTASLLVALEALEDGADVDALFAAANAEQDWQAELWGWEEDAEADRATRLAAFRSAVEFVRLARG